MDQKPTINGLQLNMVKSLCSVAQKCDSNSFSLSAKPLLLRSTEKDSSFLIDARNSLKSTCVAQCSNGELLSTFVIPEYLLYSFLSNREASSGKPLRYFITVSCICLTCQYSSEIYWYFELIFIFYWLNSHIFISLF